MSGSSEEGLPPVCCCRYSTCGIWEYSWACLYSKNIWYLLPVFSGGLGIFSIVLCYTITMVARGHFSGEIHSVPLISEAAFHSPEREIFAILVNSCAGLVGLTMVVVHRLVIWCFGLHDDLTERSRSFGSSISVGALITGLASCGGLVITGSISMSHNDAIHSLGAKLFYVLGILYAVVMTTLLHQLNEEFITLFCSDDGDCHDVEEEGEVTALGANGAIAPMILSDVRKVGSETDLRHRGGYMGGDVTSFSVASFLDGELEARLLHTRKINSLRLKLLRVLLVVLLGIPVALFAYAKVSSWCFHTELTDGGGGSSVVVVETDSRVQPEDPSDLGGNLNSPSVAPSNWMGRDTLGAVAEQVRGPYELALITLMMVWYTTLSWELLPSQSAMLLLMRRRVVLSGGSGGGGQEEKEVCYSLFEEWGLLLVGKRQDGKRQDPVVVNGGRGKQEGNGSGSLRYGDGDWLMVESYDE